MNAGRGQEDRAIGANDGVKQWAEEVASDRLQLSFTDEDAVRLVPKLIAELTPQINCLRAASNQADRVSLNRLLRVQSRLLHRLKEVP